MTNNRWLNKVNHISNHCIIPQYDELQLKKRLVWLVIALMALNQMAITIYLPSLPAMATSLHADKALIGFTITVFILGYGISQFIYGPLSDVYGRRITVIVGLIIFLLASVFAVFTPNITCLLVARTLQGIGLGCGDTMGRAILCDRFTGSDFIKAAAKIGMAATITPIFAPIAGGYMQEFIGWRSNFIFLLLYGLINFAIVILYLPETNRGIKHDQFSFSKTLGQYRSIIKNRIFLGFFIPGLVCFFGEIIYSMISPFLFQNELKLTPVEYGWISILIIVGLLIGTSAASRYSVKVSHFNMVLIGMCILGIGATLLLLPAIFHLLSIIAIIGPMLVFMIGVGIIYPNTNMGALTPFTTMAGTAGALQGGMQMIIGGALTLFASDIENKAQLPLAIVLLIATVVGLFLFSMLLVPKKPN